MIRLISDLIKSMAMSMLCVLVAVGCAGAPVTDDTPVAETESKCPDWTVEIEEDGRIFCVDRDALERERDRALDADEKRW